MNRLIVEINREYTKNQINKVVDNLFDDLKKMSLKVDSLEKDKKRLEKNKTILARAYCRKIGVIVTQKEYIRETKKNKCFCGGDKDFKVICKECSQTHGSGK